MLWYTIMNMDNYRSGSRTYQPGGHCVDYCLIIMPFLYTRTPQFIWSPAKCRVQLNVPDLQMRCGYLTAWQDMRIIAPAMASRLYVQNGPLTIYTKLRVAHVPGMAGTFSPPPRVSNPNTWCLPGSLTSGFLWSRWRGKRYRHSRCMRNPQFCLSGKRPIGMVETLRHSAHYRQR